MPDTAIRFLLNGTEALYRGDGTVSLLSYLRQSAGVTSVKDGCSAEGTCGACLVAVDRKPRLSCRTQMAKISGREVTTIEGIDAVVKNTLASAFVEAGAVQCGYCTPGMIMRSWILLTEHPDPTIEEIRRALRGHLCRCTGYKKIEDAILLGAERLKTDPSSDRGNDAFSGSVSRYRGLDTAMGKRLFVDDMAREGMLFGALRFSDHPRARVVSIDVSPAAALPGVEKVFTAEDVPGKRKTGLIVEDWPLMVAEGEVTCCIGDVLAGVAAGDMETARRAAALIDVKYEVLPPIADIEKAVDLQETVHPNQPNVLEICRTVRGDAEADLKSSRFVAKGRFTTQRIEHAFLEKESALALPEGDGIRLFSQSQGVYEDRRQIASLLDLPAKSVRITQVSTGGGFGGKEDLSVQGHACLFAHLLKLPVKVTLSRQESIRMHPKRHPVIMDIEVGASQQGRLTALKLRALGDTGAYASVGTKVMERVVGHASGGYYFPAVDVESKTVYTNNLPSGAMRGFGVNQVTFALESCVDELCRQAGFDRWQFRYDNALVDGLATVTGQKLKGVGIRACLEALKAEYESARFAGLAVGIKNVGIGNGMEDESSVIVTVDNPTRVVVKHGWTEMGQGVHTVAVTILCQETGIDPEIVEVEVDTSADLGTGMTTASRATSLMGNAMIQAARSLKDDLASHTLADLAGRTYKGRFVCDWTTSPTDETDDPVTHFSYGYAAQMCVLDDDGNIDAVYAAHDAGKVIHPVLFEGQIQGAVHMGLGYALTEDLPMKEGRLVSDRLKDCGVLRAHETPRIVVRAVEVPDPVGPYGAKGVGEIGLVPTAAAVANAMAAFDGVRRYSLPLKRDKRGTS